MAKSIRPGAGAGSSQHIQQASSNKGVPWSDEEHKAFLLGLQHVGKGNWRVISRQYVKTRTPTQVASHAQKYFLREAGVSRRRSRFAEVEEALSQDQQLDGSSQAAKRACRAPNTGTATTNSDASHQDAHGVHITGTLSHAGLSSVDNSHGSTVREPGSPSKGSSGAASASPPCSMFPCPPFMFGFPGAPGFMPAMPFVCGPMSMPLPVANMAAAAAAAAITKAMCSAGQSSGKPGSPMQMQMPIGAFPFPFPPPSFVMAQMAHMAGQMAAASQAANGVVANTDPAAAAAAAGPCSRSAGRNPQQHQDKQEQQQRGRGVLIEGELYCEEGSGYAVRGHGAPEQDACDDEHGDAMGRSVRQLDHANDFACSLMMLAGAAGEELQERQQEQRAASCSAAMVCSPAGSNQCDAGAGSGPESHDDDPRVTVAASASRLCKPEACWASAADANTAGSSTRAILEQLAVVKMEQADTAQLTRGSTGYSDSLSPADGGAMAMSGSGCAGLFGSWPSAGATGMQHGWCNGALRVSQHSAFHPLPRASQSPTVA